MKKCGKCGCGEFYASQVKKLDVIVDGNNQFLYDDTPDYKDFVYGEYEPFGPYTCVQCGMEYASLSDLPDVPEPDSNAVETEEKGE